MKHLFFCFSGYAGVGKDEACKFLVQEYGALHTGLVDPAKRHLSDLYGFSEEQLFGPSKFRNIGDLRYPKNEFYEYGIIKMITNDKEVWGSFKYIEGSKCEYKDNANFFTIEAGDSRFWLSPREALQRYCELMNLMYKNSWIRHAIDIHRTYFSNDFVRYSRMGGTQIGEPIDKSVKMSCFSDFRHLNEIRYVKSLNMDDCIFRVIRIKHPKIINPPFPHKSETEQSTISDNEFDYVVNNDSDIMGLQSQLARIINNYLEK